MLADQDGARGIGGCGDDWRRRHSRAGAQLPPNPERTTLTATATKSKTRDVLAELERLEGAWADAEQRASAISREHSATLNQAREIVDRRRAAAHRDPELVDHNGNPAEPGNAIAKLDAELGKLGNLEELGAKVVHARSIAEKRKAEALAFQGANFEQIVEALEPEAESHRDAVQAAAVALADASDRYLGFAKRVDGLRAADRRLAQLRVPAISVGAELVRNARAYSDAPPPLATELR